MKLNERWVKVKKTISLLICLSVVFIGMIFIVSVGTDVEGEMVDEGVIFINGVKIECMFPIREDFVWERTADNRMVQTDKVIEIMDFPFQTILEELGSTVTLEESTGNIYFDYAGIDYVCKLQELERSGFSTLYFIRICEFENEDSINNADYIQLNPMSADGSYCTIDNITYLTQDTGQRLFEALGCTVEIDLEQRILKIYSSSGVSITLNGTPINFDVAPIIENGRTLVPLRAIFEALGAIVEWNDDTQTVTAQKDDITVSLQIGSNELIKNGHERITLDVSAQLIGGRTLVPTRAIAGSFGAVVEWDEDTKTVTIKN